VIDDAIVGEARPGDVEFTLSWHPVGDGLHGLLQALNVCNHPVRLSNKPALIPVGLTGEPLHADTIVTAEFRPPGYAEVAPGERASARVTWAGWDGAPASGRWIVRWDGGQAEVEASGPRQPKGRGPATSLSSSWFTLMT
jgi:hypothetical protein